MINFEEFTIWLLKYYLPAMVANALPVLVNGNILIDRGKLFVDGKPVFGRNKTLEGLIVGTTGAYVAGSSLGLLFMDSFLPLISIGAGLFALLGDLAGAFVKRRLGLKPGDPAPLLDQLDFALATTLFYYILGVPEFLANQSYIPLALLVIIILHISTNIAAHALGLKKSKL